jgi:iron complex transport system substrate-binding protein
MNPAPENGFPPQRVVSLSPAVTESLASLGLGSFLVGVSDRCPEPAPRPALPRVGVPESPRLEEVLRLDPDLVLLGSENPPELIAGLSEKGVPHRLFAPVSARQAVGDLRDLVLLFSSKAALQSIVWLDRSLDWIEQSRPETPVRFFCPRDREGPADDPAAWKSVADGAYAADLLSLSGGENVFPSGGSVSRAMLARSAPDVIILPGGPFPFSDADAAALRGFLPDLPAVRNGTIAVLDGRDLFWPGTRLANAIRRLPDIFSQPARTG